MSPIRPLSNHDKQAWIRADDSIDRGMSAQQNFEEAVRNLKEAGSRDKREAWKQDGYFGAKVVDKLIIAPIANTVELLEVPFDTARAAKNAVDGLVHKAIGFFKP